MSRKEKIIEHSGFLAARLGLTLQNRELHYGSGIGRADNYCVYHGWHIVFELEFSQRHPEANVVKTWCYLDSNPQSRIFLIHHITDLNAVSPNRVNLSRWFGTKITQNLPLRFKYFLIEGDITDQAITEINAIIGTLE